MSSGIPVSDFAPAPDGAGAKRRAETVPRRRLGSVLGLVGVALVLGVIVAVALSGMTLVRLATGSMTPTYPTDSILVVRSVPAAEVTPGDVVTVSRDGTVPITHRVVSVAPGGTGAELVMRGDANDVDDPEPYQVARVGLVLGGIPFGGAALAFIQSPIGLGLATIVVASLVLWAWWPRRPPGAHVREAS